MSSVLLQSFILTILAAGDYQSRTHRDGDNDKWEIRFCEREVRANGSVSFRTKSVRNDGSVSYSEQQYNAQGEPLISGRYR